MHLNALRLLEIIQKKEVCIQGATPEHHSKRMSCTVVYTSNNVQVECENWKFLLSWLYIWFVSQLILHKDFVPLLHHAGLLYTYAYALSCSITPSTKKNKGKQLQYSMRKTIQWDLLSSRRDIFSVSQSNEARLTFTKFTMRGCDSESSLFLSKPLWTFPTRNLHGVQTTSCTCTLVSLQPMKWCTSHMSWLWNDSYAAMFVRRYSYDKE